MLIILTLNSKLWIIHELVPHPVLQILVKIADVAYPYQKPAKRVERILSYMERYSSTAMAGRAV